MSRLRFKTRLFSTLVVATNVLGNFSLTYGIRRVGALGLSPLPYIQAMATPWVLVGVTLLVCWLLTRMALLSWADLSYVLPVTSAGYVMSALLGKYFFGEQISLARWAGTLLIIGGIGLVSSTRPSTTAPEPRPRAMAAGGVS